MGSPVPASPRSGTIVQSLPAFGWRGVNGADHYEFQISADPSFNSPVLGSGQDRFTTLNTWVALQKMIPNGTYWWHVRAVSKSGGVSSWSRSRSVRKAWTTVPRLHSPANGAVVNYGRSTLTLEWSLMPLAAKYLVFLATDPNLSNLVGGQPVETSASTYTPSIVLAIGTYYWAVQPEDADNNRGARSKIASFRWAWPSGTKTSLTDLVAAPEFFDPQLSWNRVPGAAHYDVEINPSQDFAQGSKVCCDTPLVGTSFSPINVLKNNRYYWRVRAVDLDGNAGRWNEGPSFTKTFDNAPVVSGPSIKDLHVRDNNSDPGSSPPGFFTSSPVVVWEPVPGAASYEVDVYPFNMPTRPGDCDFNWRDQDHWQVLTAVPAWTPLANASTQPPFPSPSGVSQDGQSLVPLRSYCVRVRARSDRSSGADVWSDYTYLTNAFTFAGPPAPCRCSLSASGATYGSPVSGEVARRTPLFTWQAIPGAGSYFILVAKDPSFTTIVDYAFTRIPAYAPRESSNPRTYSDETTLYYWAILPSGFTEGFGAPGDPLAQSPANFQKRSAPPTILSPANAAKVTGPATFRWTAVEGARDYRVQVSQDRNFGTLLDEVVTDSTAYTSTKTLPANAALYVRVRAEDENQIGLTWAAVRSFRNVLQSPRPSAKPSRGDLIPTWRWSPVPLAVSYDFHADLPDGSTRDFQNLRSPAVTPTTLTGTGVFHWQVRAEFPQTGGGTVPGPFTARVAFTRTIKPPTGARTVSNEASVLFAWNPKLGAKSYRIQVARTPDFSQQVDGQELHGTSYAPGLDQYRDGGRFYWHVAAVDADGNSGSYTATRSFSLRPRK